VVLSPPHISKCYREIFLVFLPGDERAGQQGKVVALLPMPEDLMRPSISHGCADPRSGRVDLASVKL
jgi:hypothetical protein